MKMGAAPFYFWFPKVMKEISWMNNYLLMTWQKIIPMTLIYYFMSKIMIYSSIVLSVIMGSIMAFNQTNLKMIMAFSSINHMGWLMTTLTLNMIIWIIYLLNYFMLNFIICKMFNMMNLKYLMNIFIMNYPPLLKIMLLINFFSLGGIPPFLGFLPKWMTIMTLMYTKSYLIMIILITTTLINLFFYLRLMIPTLILSSTQIKFTLYNNKFNNFNLINLIFLSFMNLLIMMFLTLIYHLI
uniref:NADH-ubiquinone oxidoreductase chain 2 n=1 Tax=Ylodes simulans TaxID=2719101 RepID=A0A7D6W5L6_9NEOP|nr:NADH dehydrogenase subunit 2 [Ylodes simulans]